MDTVARQKQLEIITRCKKNIPTFRFDKDKIIQVLTNLINNAIKFTEKGSVTIATSVKDNIVQVAVSDTGMGVKKEDLDRLFNYFEQIGGKERKVGGTGLGLVISKEIVARHNGKIWVKSEFGKGTTFYFVLPV